MDVRKSRKWIGDKRMVGFVEDFFDDFNLFHDKKTQVITFCSKKKWQEFNSKCNQTEVNEFTRCFYTFQRYSSSYYFSSSFQSFSTLNNANQSNLGSAMIGKPKQIQSKISSKLISAPPFPTTPRSHLPRGKFHARSNSNPLLFPTPRLVRLIFSLLPSYFPISPGTCSNGQHVYRSSV